MTDYIAKLQAEFEKNKNKEKAEKNSIDFLEKIITTKSWWDTIDYLAVKPVGVVYFGEYPEQIIPVTDRWINSDNMWLQRSALLHQLKYKENTNTQLLFKF